MSIIQNRTTASFTKELFIIFLFHILKLTGASNCYRTRNIKVKEVLNLFLL
jgi:hypothetical protein